ncbi:MAG: hypothetical protein LUF35_03065, partial [Lachnospiraceae bacterium]|nr:hypothetical protein [Lachnospiraceae bacterium]
DKIYVFSILKFLHETTLRHRKKVLTVLFCKRKLNHRNRANAQGKTMNVVCLFSHTFLQRKDKDYGEKKY